MLKFHLNTSLGINLATNPLDTIDKLITALDDSYGYVTEYVAKNDSGRIKHMSIRKNGIEYMSVSEEMGQYATPEFISQLARFVELNHVQSVLYELIPRMAALGLRAVLIGQEEHIKAARADDFVKIVSSDDDTCYPTTYGGMLKLRQAVDMAEVNYLIESNMSKMLSCGWRYSDSGDGCHIIMFDNKFKSIRYNDVNAAKELIAELGAQISKLKTDALI